MLKNVIKKKMNLLFIVVDCFKSFLYNYISYIYESFFFFISYVKVLLFMCNLCVIYVFNINKRNEKNNYK